MKLVTAVLSFLLISGVVAAQAPAKPADPASTTTPKAAPAPTKPIPQLTSEEETQVLFLQRNIARIDANMSAEEKQQVKYRNQLAELANNIQKRLGPGFVIDPDTLVVTTAPVTATPAPAPAVTNSTPAPDKKK